MPTGTPSLSLEEVELIAAQAFLPSATQLWGIEVERLVTSTDRSLRRPSEPAMTALQVQRLPLGSRFTTEPGGQAELSTMPAVGVDAMLDALNVDLAELTRRLASIGFFGEDQALDSARPPERILQQQRYAAMESFFSAGGQAGTWMMCNSASVQLNVSHDPLDPTRRWMLLHRLAPVLIACFANSPGHDTQGRSWKSLRQANWWAIDPNRTAPPAWQELSAGRAWAQYGLNADVMLIRASGHVEPLQPGMSFAHWLRFGHQLGWPTAEDFRYHLTTLFPPIRPRGWLEIRFLDALAPAHRVAAVLALAACLTDRGASELEQVLPDLSHLWQESARVGLAHPELAAAGRLVFDIAQDLVASISTSPPRLAMFHDFRSEFVDRGRCPADEALTTASLVLSLQHHGDARHMGESKPRSTLVPA